MAENTGESFAYHILPAKTINNVPRYRNPVVLVRLVVRPRYLFSPGAPRYSKDVDGFKFYNTNGDELFSDVQSETKPAEQELIDEELSRSASIISPSPNDAEPGQHQSQSSIALLTLDVDLPTILEEQEDEEINDQPIIE